MVHQPYLVLCIFLFTVYILVTASADSSFNRSSFPSGFVFGTGTSSYQVEGAANEGGRGPSIWDVFTQKHPEKIKDRSCGNVAIDAYGRYKEDVRLMNDLGIDAYRFSISWSRILPSGKLSGGINQAGVEYYNNLINKLLSKGIQPYGTIFHWDLPQSLEDEYLGFFSPRIVVGDSSREPYLVAHNQLLAQAAAVKVYRDKYQAASSWLCIYPQGIRKLLLHIKNKYNNPTIYITENGVDEVNN